MRFFTEMAGISDKALGKLDSKNKFNSGMEIEEDYGMNLYETFFRQYGPQIGRFNGVDLLAESAIGRNPYQFGNNNPVSFNDPNGDRPMMPQDDSRGQLTVWNNLRTTPSWVSNSWDRYLGEYYANLNRRDEERNGGGGGGVTQIEGGVSISGEMAKEVFKSIVDAINGNGRVWIPGFGYYDGSLYPEDAKWVALSEVVVSFRQRITVDNTKQATKYYYEGFGEPAHLGPNTFDALIKSEDFIYHHKRILEGKTTSLTGNFAVDLTSSQFYIGRTNVKYTIGCANGQCKVTYTLFANDGYWDPNFVAEKTFGWLGFDKFQPDGMGPNLEFSGGHPYPFIPIVTIYQFRNPGY